MIAYILNVLLSFILIYKYYAIFIITYLSAVCLPLPSTSIVIAAAAFASQGYLGIGWVVLVAFLGNILGDNTGYFLTRIYGKKIIDRFTFLKKIFDSQYISRLEDLLRSRPVVTIFISRFMAQIGPAVDLLGGLIKFDYRIYVITELIGELTQVCIFSGIGFFLGDEWQSYTGIIGSVGTILVVLTLIYVVRKVFFVKVKV